MKKLLVFTVLGILAVPAGVYLFYPRPRPEYCWLVFGPEGRLRVLVRLQGESISIDRNGEGAFNAKKDRFRTLPDCKDVTIADPDGETSYVLRGVNEFQHEGQRRLVFSVNVKGPVEYRQYCDVATQRDPRDAPESHFHGPLKMELRKLKQEFPFGMALKTGEKPSHLHAFVGTFNAEKGCWAVVSTEDGTKSPFPDGIFPFVEIEFPPKAPGRSPLRKRYPLNEFC